MQLIHRVRRETGSLSERTALSLLTACLIFAAILIFPEKQLNDGDTLWHIVLGQEILETGRLPEKDAFSHTFAGENYQTNSWLSDVLLGAAYDLDGFAGVVALSSFCVALTFFLLQREYLRSLGDKQAMYFSCASFLLLAPHLLSRPHVLVFPLAALWAIILLRAEEEDRTPPLWSLLILFLWVNMHGSFLLAFVVTVPVFLSAIFTEGAFDRRKLQSWGVFLASMAATALIGPYGLNPLRTAFSVIRLGPLLSAIPEWRAEDFSSFGAFEAVLLAMIGALTLTGVKLSLARTVILLGLLHMGLSHTRSVDYLAIFGSVLLAQPLAFAITKKTPSLHLTHLLPIGVAMAMAGALALHLRTVFPPDLAYPKRAIRFARHNGAHGNVFNDYRFGGALIFEGVKVFIDSRAEFYPASFLQNYLDVIGQPQIDRLDAFLETNDIGWTLLEPNQAAAAVMGKLPGWREAYRDDAAVVHVRLQQSR